MTEREEPLMSSEQTIAWSDRRVSDETVYRIAEAGGGNITLRPMVGEDMTGIDFQPVPEGGIDWGSYRETMDKLEPDSEQLHRMRATYYSQMGRIGYFPSATEGERLLQLALDDHATGTRDAAAMTAALLAAGFENTATFSYPEQGRTVAMWKRDSRRGHYEITIEADGSVALSFERTRAGHCDNLLRADFNLIAQDYRRIPLFWPDFVTPSSALAMALSAADAHEAALPVRRKRRQGEDMPFREDRSRPTGTPGR